MPGSTAELYASLPPDEDDSLRPVLVALAESRVSRRLAERVRALAVWGPPSLMPRRETDVYRVLPDEDMGGGAMRTAQCHTISEARQWLKQRVLSLFLDTPILGPRASRRKTRRALRELRDRLSIMLQTVAADDDLPF